MFFLKFKTRQLGNHTHVHVFAGKDTETYGKCGNLIFRKDEWDAFARAIMESSYPRQSDSNSDPSGVISNAYINDLTITLDEEYDYAKRK